jgi:hypothetical protein
MCVGCTLYPATYRTMNALSLSICSRETSRSAVEGTPSSSIYVCGGGRCQKRCVPLSSS